MESLFIDKWRWFSIQSSPKFYQRKLYTTFFLCTSSLESLSRSKLRGHLLQELTSLILTKILSICVLLVTVTNLWQTHIQKNVGTCRVSALLFLYFLMVPVNNVLQSIVIWVAVVIDLATFFAQLVNYLFTSNGSWWRRSCAINNEQKFYLHHFDLLLRITETLIKPF